MACIGLAVRSNGMHWFARENKWHVLDHNEGLRIIKATFENIIIYKPEAIFCLGIFCLALCSPPSDGFPVGLQKKKKLLRSACILIIDLR